MTGKTFWLGLLFIVICIQGCSKSESTTRPDTEKKTTLGAWRPGEKVSYKWPDDFKLPLLITLEVPEVPKEIQGPSLPILEDKKQPTQQRSTNFPWFF